MPGKMNSTSGKMSLTAVLAAFSSANLAAAGPHRVALHAQGLGDARAELVGLDQHAGQAAEVGHAGARAQFVQHFAARPAHLQLEVGQRELLGDDRDRSSSFPRRPCAWPGRGPGRPRRRRPSGPGRRAGRGRSPACGCWPMKPDDQVGQVEADAGHADGVRSATFCVDAAHRAGSCRRRATSPTSRPANFSPRKMLPAASLRKPALASLALSLLDVPLRSWAAAAWPRRAWPFRAPWSSRRLFRGARRLRGRGACAGSSARRAVPRRAACRRRSDPAPTRPARRTRRTRPSGIRLSKIDQSWRRKHHG